MRPLAKASRRVGTPPSWRPGLLLRLVWLALALLFCGFDTPALAQSAPEFRIVVHPSNPARSVSRAFAADAFLKKVTRWGSGEVIQPVDQRSDSAARRQFSESVLKRSVTAVRNYWQQRIFSGRDVPPPELDSDASVVAYVARHPGSVGYVSGGAELGGARELPLD